MTLGTSLFLIAVGAILRFAVTASVSGVDLNVVGLILMIVGIVGAIVSLFWMFWPRRTAADPVVRDPVVRERRDVY